MSPGTVQRMPRPCLPASRRPRRTWKMSSSGWPFVAALVAASVAAVAVAAAASSVAAIVSLLSGSSGTMHLERCRRTIEEGVSSSAPHKPPSEEEDGAEDAAERTTPRTWCVPKCVAEWTTVCVDHSEEYSDDAADDARGRRGGRSSKRSGGKGSICVQGTSTALRLAGAGRSLDLAQPAASRTPGTSCYSRAASKDDQGLREARYVGHDDEPGCTALLGV